MRFLTAQEVTLFGTDDGCEQRCRFRKQGYRMPDRQTCLTSETEMAKQPHYGTTAKVLHWCVVALLIVQYPLGKFMPHIRRGMTPGDAMTFHMSFGITILALMVLRLFWRITHPVAPASSLPAWQQTISEAVHWLLYAL